MRLSNTTVRSTWLVAAIIGLLLAFATIYLQSNTTVSLSDSIAENAVTEALEHAYEVLDTPFDQLDLAQLSEVFVDHPDYYSELSEDRRVQIQAYINKILGKTESFGYLTAMRARRIHQQQGAKLLKPLLEKAELEKHNLTPKEWKKLAQQNYGEYPAIPNAELPKRQILRYDFIDINGDKARIQFDDGAALQKALFVRIDGRWYIAGIIAINVHF